MGQDINIKYDHKAIEDGKYDFWLKNDLFKASGKGETFSIVIPPPNVTGKLHIGHAWDTTIQDMIVRRKRMMGYDSLWVPGMDHAGIATQAKIDAKLKAQGISRYDIGREAFLKVSWDWKEEYASIIRSQWKALGLSLDYSRERFTLDKGLNDAVNHVFITLYNKGLIYQGDRIINWDPEAKTALSNIEVEHKDVEGAFYYLKYRLVDGSGEVIIATTRPETMFADQALMVHPDDERFKDIVGKHVYIPGTSVEIPIITDSYVDMEFGSGIVKVTPAHDPNDFEVGLRHGLKMPLCMNDDGTMNEMAFQYEGMDRLECRDKLIKDLEELGYLDHIEKIIHSVGHSERTGVMVEPRLSKQWFVKMKTLAENALKADVEFVPSRFRNTFERWMMDINDWCISRQLWWGHRIPAWYKDDKVLVQVESPGEGWVQDEDVLDTWFSSALWPFSTLGWPNKTPDFERYFPTNLLVTGYDIIFFWVSRMIFQSVEFTKKAPFKEVLIHGLIRDSLGRKMSKSLGNGVDPFDVIEKYGCDTLRYFLNTNSSPGMDLRFDETKIESSWNYLNKLWNISRFVLINTEGASEEINVDKLNLPSKWILSKLNKVIKEVDYNFDKYEFGEVARSLYNFVWDDFANTYVEFSKVDLKNNDDSSNTKAVLIYVLKAIIKMLHPFIPFITEEIYQSLPHNEISIMISNWPISNPSYNFDLEEASFETISNIITSVRNARNEAKKGNSIPLTFYLITQNENLTASLGNSYAYLERFLNPKKLVIASDYQFEEKMHLISLADINIFIPANELVDINEVIKKLQDEKIRLENEIKRSTNMLSNENFLSKAKPEKIEAEKEKFESYKKQLDDVIKHLEEINN